MNVLSLFDGISCARVALDRAGIPVASYHACEIDSHAIAISKKNHPDIVHLGDVRTAVLPASVDLLIGGSPCQDLSIAKKDRKGLDGDRSGLFWEYVRILRDTNPLFFVLENVASMPKKDMDIISETLGVQPILINASLVSAQSRRRLFWTNIPNVDQPADRGILLKDILEADVDDKFQVKGKFTQTAHTGRDLVKVGHIGNGPSQGNRVYSTDGKSVTLSANGGGCGAKTGLYWTEPQYPIHVPDGSSTEPVRVGHEQRRKLKDGKRADDDPTIEAVRRIETRNDDKCGTLTTVLKDNHIVDVATHRIRKLTPIECERLQGLPDDYTHGIAITNRYKCLGNAFNADVVAHILSSIHNGV